jgi:hypothetical protein
MNCRIDRDYSKSISVIKFMQQEKFTLTNKQKACTYVAHNGMSTIDLVFLDNKLTLRTQYVVTNTTSAPIRKHLPVVTIVKTRPVENRPKDTIPVKTSRKLHTKELGSVNVQNILKDIDQGNLKESTDALECIINNATLPIEQKERKAKPWLDKICYAKRKLFLGKIQRAKKIGTEDSLNSYAQTRREYKHLLKCRIPPSLL